MKGSNRYASTVGFLGFLALAANAIPPALAQEDPARYPSKPIHIIVGFAAGGGNDIIARVFGQKLSENLGQPVIVENKPGGGAIVATEYVAKSAPDGYTLLMSASGISINPAVYAKLPYDVAQAKTLIAQSKYPSGFSGPRLWLPSGNQVGRDNAVLAKDMWDKIGINLTIEEVEGSTLSKSSYAADFDAIPLNDSFGGYSINGVRRLAEVVEGGRLSFPRLFGRV